MANNFNWNTEEDVWAEDGETAVSPPPKPNQSRRWLTLFFLLIITIGTFTFLRRQINERVNANMMVLELDITSSHTIVQQTRKTNDGDLFRTVLSGSDDHWTNNTVAALERDLLFNPIPFGFHQQTTSTTLTPNIEVEPDLKAGLLTFTQTYTLPQTVNNAPQTVTLAQTAVYRLGQERWLLSPPTASFWGETVTYQGTYLTAHAPERDAEYVERLVDDINNALATLCQAATCPPNHHRTLTLSVAPDAMRVLSDTAAAPIQWTNALTLPTISLVGTPTDEAGYDALLRGYLGHVTLGFMPQISGDADAISPLINDSLAQIKAPDAAAMLAATAEIRQQYQERWLTAVINQEYTPLLAADATLASANIWVEDLIETYNGRDIYDRSPWGLLRTETPPTFHQLILERDLRQARVLTAVEYTTETAPQTPYTLHQVTYYGASPSNGSWQLANPTRILRTADQPHAGKRVDFRYFAEEEAYIIPLVQRLDTYIDAWCDELLQNGCAETTFFFNNAMQPPINRLRLQDQATVEALLPPFTFIGLPASAVEAEHLQNGYLMTILGHLISQSDATTPAETYYNQAIYRRAQAEFGIHEWNTTTGLTLADADLTLQTLCYPIDSSPVIANYALTTGQWQATPMTYDTPILIANEGDMLLRELDENSTGSPRTRLWLWPNGRFEEDRLILDWVDGFVFSVARFLPSLNNDNIPIAISTDEQRFYELDIADCDDSGCAQQASDYIVNYAPNGRSSLLLSQEQGLVIYKIGDEAGSEVQNLPTIQPPFWIDEQTLVFVPILTSDIVTLNTATMEETILVEEDRLTTHPDLADGSIGTAFIELLPLAEDTEKLLIRYAPRNSRFNSEEPTYFFFYDWVEDELSDPIPVTNGVLTTDSLSPDGQWIATLSWERTSGTINTLHLIHTETSALQTYAIPTDAFIEAHWHQESSWLFVEKNGRIDLINPNTEEIYTITPPHYACNSTHWRYNN